MLVLTEEPVGSELAVYTRQTSFGFLASDPLAFASQVLGLQTWGFLVYCVSPSPKVPHLIFTRSVH